jgi:hypothetical protein
LYGLIAETLWINVTANPTAEWIARQITEAFPWDAAPGYIGFAGVGAITYRRRKSVAIAA